jgi:hypothetical protein
MSFYPKTAGGSNLYFEADDCDEFGFSCEESVNSGL